MKRIVVQAANPAGKGKALFVPLSRDLSAIDEKRLNIAISRVIGMMRDARMRIETLEVHQLDIVDTDTKGAK